MRREFQPGDRVRIRSYEECNEIWLDFQKISLSQEGYTDFVNRYGKEFIVHKRNGHWASETVLDLTPIEKEATRPLVNERLFVSSFRNY